MSDVPGERDEAVLEVVRHIPPGRLVAYGDVALIVAELGIPCTARQAAATLSHFGSGAPWWRVVQAAGTLAEPVAASAGERLIAEGVPVVGARVPLRQLRWTPDAAEFAAIAADFGGAAP